jgi:2-polyprenyl-3-methyl-5-hydroxy-6-metoxy-1,4-benzoquinol methylase
MDPANYYDDSYFQWQGALGTFTGEMEAEKFLHYIRDDHMVMDFGCGGGFLLNAIKCQRKLGVEVNPAARRSASKLGIDTIASITDAPDATFDVVISNHALEHVPSPIDITKSVLAKLKPGGIAVFVVPCERYDTAYAPQNVDRHLYTWSPMNLGNLFQASGFNVR